MGPSFVRFPLVLGALPFSVMLAEPSLVLRTDGLKSNLTTSFSLVDFDKDGSLDILVEGEDGSFRIFLDGEQDFSSSFNLAVDGRHKIANRKVGSRVGKISVLDPDSSVLPTIQSFSIDGDDQGFFQIDEGGNLSVTKSLIGDEFSLTVRAVTSLGEQLSREFVLYSQEAPTGILFSANQSSLESTIRSSSFNLIDVDGDGDLDLVTESTDGKFYLESNQGDSISSPQQIYPEASVIAISGSDTSVGFFHAYDPDDPHSEGVYRFSLVDGENSQSNNSFTLSEDGRLSAKSLLSPGDYFLRVRVTDSSDLSLERTFTLRKQNELHGLLITPYADMDWSAPSLETESSQFERNATNSMLLVDLDRDGDLDLISEDLSGRFFLNQNLQGEFSKDLPLFPNPVIPFEANASVGSRIASVLAVDSDSLGNQSYQFQLIKDAENTHSGLFGIDSSGTISLAAEPPQGILKIKVRATGSDGVSVENAFELKAVEPTRFSPDSIFLSNDKILENEKAGSVVGKLQATDGNANALHVFAFVGQGNEAFQILEDGTLVTLEPLDYESKNFHTVRIRATNQYQMFLEQDLTIGVIDVKEDHDKDGIEDHKDPDDDNDGFTDLQELELGNNPLDASDFPKFPPDGILISVQEVEENRPIGSSIGYLEASGKNAGVGYQFELVPDELQANPISVEANGSLIVSDRIDFEKQQLIVLKVRATNDFGLSMERSFEIAVLDLDEVDLPIARTLDYSMISKQEILLSGTLLSNGNSENVEVGFVVGKKMSLDPGDPSVARLVVKTMDGGSDFSTSFLPNEVGGYYYRSYAVNEKGTVYGAVRRLIVEGEQTPDKDSIGFWTGSFDPESGWLETSWFGSVRVYPNGWIYHLEFGWLYSSKASSGVWLWKEGFGWLWTGEGIFPFFFLNQSQDWLFYFVGQNGNRYFYDYHLNSVVNADSVLYLGAKQEEEAQVVLTAANGQTVVEMLDGNYRYKDFEGTTTWSVFQNASGGWQIRTGFHENGQTFGTEGAHDQLPEGEYPKHAYEIDDDGVYVYIYKWLEGTFVTYYKIESVDNGVVTSRFGRSLDNLDGVSYFFTDRKTAVEFFDSRNALSNY